MEKKNVISLERLNTISQEILNEETFDGIYNVFDLAHIEDFYVRDEYGNSMPLVEFLKSLYEQVEITER